MSKKNVFDYLIQVMLVFAYTVLVLNVFCLIFGEGAKDISSIFSLGKSGIPAITVFQFLGMSMIVVGIKSIFDADFMLGRMKNTPRIMIMMTAIFIVIAVFAAIFKWLPINRGTPWVLYVVCYVVSATISCIFAKIKMNFEDKRLNEALEKLKNNV